MISIMQTGADQGMQTIDRALQQAYQQGLISLEDALPLVTDEKAFRSSLGAV